MSRGSGLRISVHPIAQTVEISFSTSTAQATVPAKNSERTTVITLMIVGTAMIVGGNALRVS